MSRDGRSAVQLTELAGAEISRSCDHPGDDGTALFVALTTPHAGMPMFTFTAKQRDDIISYIRSLH